MLWTCRERLQDRPGIVEGRSCNYANRTAAPATAASPQRTIGLIRPGAAALAESSSSPAVPLPKLEFDGRVWLSEAVLLALASTEALALCSDNLCCSSLSSSASLSIGVGSGSFGVRVTGRYSNRSFSSNWLYTARYSPVLVSDSVEDDGRGFGRCVTVTELDMTSSKGLRHARISCCCS